MSLLQFNHLAVLTSALMQWILGAVWYSLFFAKPWKTMVDVRTETKKNRMIIGMIASFIGSLILSFMLLHVLWWAGAKDLRQGAFVGFILWLGFIAAPLFAQHIYEARPFKLFAINAGYWLVALLMSGALLACWQ